MDDSVEFGRMAVIVVVALAFGFLDLIVAPRWWTMLLWILAAWLFISVEYTRSIARRALGNCENELMKVQATNERLLDKDANETTQRAQARLFAYLAKSPTLEADFPKHVSDMRSAVGQLRNAETIDFLRQSASGGELHATRVAALVDHVDAFLAAVDSTE